jgi:hypothetical protein
MQNHNIRKHYIYRERDIEICLCIPAGHGNDRDEVEPIKQ